MKKEHVVEMRTAEKKFNTIVLVSSGTAVGMIVYFFLGYIK